MKKPLAKHVPRVYQARNLPWGRRGLAGARPDPADPTLPLPDVMNSKGW
jgi:hypothetical protein